MARTNPLTSAPPKEIPLVAAPLVRVLAQVRFSEIMSLQDEAFVGPFQEAIRETYPRLDRGKGRHVVLGIGGVETVTENLIWRFSDVEGTWRVSLSSDFVALETLRYSSRRDFLERLKFVLSALQRNFNPQLVERFGLRYVDRLSGEDTEELVNLLQPEVAGILTTELGSSVRQTISESVFDLPEGKGQILARWGFLPGGTTIDPSVVEPIQERSWILDLDMSTSGERRFDIEQLMDEALSFAKHLYAFFRWSVKDEFLRKFGGEI